MDSSKRDRLYRGIAADILEAPDAPVSDDTKLVNYDSVSWLHVIIMLDEIFGVTADPDAVKACKTAGDVLGLVA